MSPASRDSSRPCCMPGCGEPRARTSRCRDHAREYERDAHARRSGGGGDHVPIRSAESAALRARIVAEGQIDPESPWGDA